MKEFQLSSYKDMFFFNCLNLAIQYLTLKTESEKSTEEENLLTFLITVLQGLRRVK